MSEKGYAGDISPSEAWQRLQTEPKAVLVDVRTQPEWVYVGLPALNQANKQTICVSWQVYPSMSQNPEFATELAAQGVGPDNMILFLCRSGVRSAAAATFMSAQGWKQCFNVSDGFEGPLDSDKHRGGLGGWKAEGLPWKQG
jgi:rhodanese-related sulfurtransferase